MERATVGVDAELAIPRCPDPLNRRSLRARMGTVFQVPLTRIPRPSGIGELQASGVTAAPLALLDDSVMLDEFVEQGNGKGACIFGTEGHVLEDVTLAAVDGVVKIPMAGGLIESGGFRCRRLLRNALEIMTQHGQCQPVPSAKNLPATSE